MLHNLTKFFCSLIIFCFCATLLFAQEGSECPPNIGFEKGDFSGWECYTGYADNFSPGNVVVGLSSPDVQRHFIIPSSPNNAPDPYSNGELKLDVSPNGSNYIIKLGNDGSGRREAEGISYTFKIPDNAAVYTITYNYAVVFSSGSHQPWEQPKFESKVFDVASGTEIDCSGASFTATSDLPGFKLSPIRVSASAVYYKDWSPVTIDLSGYAGKTIKLLFTTNDCCPNGRTGGSHFGYAYIDVNESCASPITGNIICPGVTDQLMLKAPSGMMEYHWTSASNLSTDIGTESTLTIRPVPPVNTSYALRMKPYPNIGGCEVTVFTTIKSFDGQLNLNVSPAPVTACSDVGADLTNPMITTGSSPGMIFTYHTDAAATSFLAGAKAVKKSGTYYIKGTGPSGCFYIKPIQVLIYDPPNLNITNPPPVCKPANGNLTLSSITSGSTVGISLSYWKDAAATIPLTSPQSIAQTGTYYIQATSPGTCPIVKPVMVTVAELPKLLINNVSVCAGEAPKQEAITAGSSSGLTFSYWKDAACTLAIPGLANIQESGTYYVRAVNSVNCVLVAPFKVTVYPEVDLIVTSSVVKVNYPETADLTSVVTPVNGLIYTYWQDQATTKVVSNPSAVSVVGTYYVKAENANKCNEIQPIKVEIVPPPLPMVKGTNAFTPNADGTNDIFKMELTGIIRLNYFKIFDRWGQLAFYSRNISEGWNGKKDGYDAPTGTYYWIFDGYDDYYKQKVNASGSITLIR